MVSREEVVSCYTYILGRSPENLDVIESHLSAKTLSDIVLQHNPPPLITFILENILKKLSVGGVAVFQVPTWCKGYSFHLNEYLQNPKPLHMEMHVLPQEQVFKIIERNGCRVLEVREDGLADGRTAYTISNTFFVVKE